MPHSIRACLCTLLACLCVACGARSPEPNYYILTPPALLHIPASAANTSASRAVATILNTENIARAHLIVGPIALPDYLDRTSLIARDARTAEITIYSNSLWSEPLQAAFTRLLATAINRSAKTTLALPGSAPFETSAYLRLSINQFDGEPNGFCTLDTYWFLLDPRGKSLQDGHFIAEARAGNSVQSMVETLSQLVMQLGASIAPTMDTLAISP